MEHQGIPPTTDDAAVATVLARAEQAVAEAAERLLVERLHRLLDEQGSAAVSSLSATLLPLLQSLVIVLPRALTDGASPAVLTAARTLGASIRLHGVPLSALLSEGAAVHDRLLQAVASEVRATDLAVVAAMLRISQALLDVERAVVLAYQQESAEPAPAPRDDPESGLTAWAHLMERLSREARPARDAARPLALVLMALDGADGEQARAFAALLRRHTRAVDTASRSPDGLYALVMPQTDRAGASRALDRLQLAVATALPARRLLGVAVAARDDDAGGSELLDRARGALEALRGPVP